MPPFVQSLGGFDYGECPGSRWVGRTNLLLRAPARGIAAASPATGA